MIKNKLDDKYYEIITYNQSFTARVALAKEEVKMYYKELKEELLSYVGVRSRISWQYDSFSYQRNKKAILTVRGNTLTIYLALDLNSISPKYRLRDEGHKTSYKDTPLALKVKGSRTLNYAKELIKLLFSELEYEPKKINEKVFNNNFISRTITEFVELGLIKEVRRKKLITTYHRVKIYAVVLPKNNLDNLYVVGNITKLGNWDPKLGVKMVKVYDNFYQVSLNIPAGHLEFKIVGQNAFENVEKGIWVEEIVNHHYEINKTMLIEDIIHSFREGKYE